MSELRSATNCGFLLDHSTEFGTSSRQQTGMIMTLTVTMGSIMKKIMMVVMVMMIILMVMLIMVIVKMMMMMMTEASHCLSSRNLLHDARRKEFHLCVLIRLFTSDCR